MDEDYLAYRLAQTTYLGEEILQHGIPIIEPPGAHAIYIDAAQLLSHIPKEHFPGQALAVELYIEAGIRSVEIGSVAFTRVNPETGEKIFPTLELVRLAIPRRVYTQSHLDYVVKALRNITSRKDSIKGYKMTKAPRFLRHFTAQFEPL